MADQRPRGKQAAGASQGRFHLVTALWEEAFANVF